MADKERNVKDLLADINTMVKAQILTPEYEVDLDSYVCFTVRNPNGRTMLHAGKMSIYPELHETFVGLFLNETADIYKIIGIYSFPEYMK